jgi:hypothetical protein
VMRSGENTKRIKINKKSKKISKGWFWGCGSGCGWPRFAVHAEMPIMIITNKIKQPQPDPQPQNQPLLNFTKGK